MTNLLFTSPFHPETTLQVHIVTLHYARDRADLVQDTKKKKCTTEEYILQ